MTSSRAANGRFRAGLLPPEVLLLGTLRHSMRWSFVIERIRKDARGVAAGVPLAGRKILAQHLGAGEARFRSRSPVGAAQKCVDASRLRDSRCIIRCYLMNLVLKGHGFQPCRKWAFPGRAFSPRGTVIWDAPAFHEMVSRH